MIAYVCGMDKIEHKETYLEEMVKCKCTIGSLFTNSIYVQLTILELRKKLIFLVQVEL